MKVIATFFTTLATILTFSWADNIAAIENGNMNVTNVLLASNLCNAVKPSTYSWAKQKFPHIAFALEATENQPIGTWYTDRQSDFGSIARQAVGSCRDGRVPTIVIYGLPNKDCEGHFSSGGANKTPEDYRRFIQTLVDAVGNNEVIYILEPDAMGLLLAGSACANQYGYNSNIQNAIQILSRNSKSKLYLDIGFWVLNPSNNYSIGQIIQSMDPNRKINGISINTSNFRYTHELIEMCKSFSGANGNKYHCVLDISRNYNGPDANSAWCNPRGRGIGYLPTMYTNEPLIDYYLWIKPPGESDGTCNGGPEAGQFFYEGFRELWNNGYFVKNLGMRTI